VFNDDDDDDDDSVSLGTWMYTIAVGEPYRSIIQTGVDLWMIDMSLVV